MTEAKRQSAVETTGPVVSAADRKSPNPSNNQATHSPGRAPLTEPHPELFRDRYRPQTTRLQNWDYAGDGSYFVTICTFNREQRLSSVENAAVTLTPAGRIVDDEWRLTPTLRPYVTLDHFVVMPNHVHGILHIRGRHSKNRGVEPPRAAASSPGRRRRLLGDEGMPR